MKRVPNGSLIQYIGALGDIHLYLIINEGMYYHIRTWGDGKVEGYLYKKKCNWEAFLVRHPDKWKVL